MGFTTLCDIAFGVFMVSWLASRHVSYIMVLWSIYAQSPHIMTNSCYKGSAANLEGPFDPPPGLSYLLEPFYKTDGIVCFTHTIRWMFLAPLIMLQCITIFWFVLIVRVAVKVIRGDGAEDSRSDDEGDEEELDEEEGEEFIYEEAEALQQEVGVEALDLKGWERRHGVRIQSSSSGVSLPGHSDRKELLGRIGCEKQVD